MFFRDKRKGTGPEVKQKRKDYDAYLTVEASFIIPLSFLLIILTLYFGFFCYEKSITLQCSYLASLRGANEWELSGETLKRYVERELYSLLEEKQLYSIENKFIINANIMGVEVILEEYIEVPFASVRGDGIIGWNISSGKKAIRNKPSSYIRRYQSIKE